MRGVYTASATISVTTNKTLLLLQAPSTAVLEVLSVSLGNTTVETSEQLQIGLYRATTVGSPAGTSVTPAKHENLDATSVATVLADLSGEPTTYNTVPLDQQGANNLAGYRYDPTPEERPIVAPSGAMGLRLLAAPSNSFTGTVQVVYREIG